MRRILIVGSGQSGLQLAIGLLDEGYDVTVMSARTPEEVRAGRVMSTQCLFGTALGYERGLELNHWEDQAPKIGGIGVSVAGPDGDRAADWLGRLDEFAQSVDQRVKTADWMEEFEANGGKLAIAGATVSDLEHLSGLFDLVVVAAGRGEITQLFDRDAARSPYTVPQRALSLAYVHGMAPRPEHPDTPAVRLNIIPGAGELFTVPSYTLSGPCDILFFEGVPGGPLDVFDGAAGPQEHLRRILELTERFAPWEYQRCAGVELTDERGVLAGRYTPVVRDPVGVLGNGRLVLGMADAVVANDPLTSQGANSAAKNAAVYHRAIVDHGDQPFDEAFMRGAFDAYWEIARPVTEWTTMFLDPPAHVLRVLRAAERHPEAADRFANGFDDPSRFADWLMRPEDADAYLARLAGQSAA